MKDFGMKELHPQLYLPSHFKIEDRAELLAFMRTHPLGQVISQNMNGELVINYLPLMVEEKEAGLFLSGHLALANTSWRDWESRSSEEKQVTVVFRGEDGYISPTWYENPLNVPTWNYSVVHASGKVRVNHEDSLKEAMLLKQVAVFEEREKQIGEVKWDYKLPDDFRNKLLKSIVSFEIEVLKLEGKFKLGQNRQEADKKKARAVLEQSGRNINLIRDQLK